MTVLLERVAEAPVVVEAPAVVEAPVRARTHVEPIVLDLVDVWGQDSFPASDPPANW
jgi:hypothetical protein